MMIPITSLNLSVAGNGPFDDGWARKLKVRGRGDRAHLATDDTHFMQIQVCSGIVVEQF